MAVYKEEKTGTWRVIYRYTDWKGERRQSQKRGFKTKREAQAWEREQLSKAALDLEMMFTMKYSEANIRKCLNKGLSNPEHLDRANANIIRTLLRLEPDIVPQERTVIGCSAHRALALEAAEK